MHFSGERAFDSKICRRFERVERGKIASGFDGSSSRWYRLSEPESEIQSVEVGFLVSTSTSTSLGLIKPAASDAIRWSNVDRARGERSVSSPP